MIDGGENNFDNPAIRNHQIGARTRVALSSRKIQGKRHQSRLRSFVASPFLHSRAHDSTTEHSE